VSASFVFSQVALSETVQRGGTHTNEKTIDLSGGGIPNQVGEDTGTSFPTDNSNEGSTEPGLNIPSLPPLSPGGIIPGGGLPGTGIPGSFPGGIGGSSGYYPPNSPYAPWNPYNNNGLGWKPGMIAIEQSMVPGVVCPLVDNRPQIELLAAINNLFNYILPDDNCYAGLNDRQNNNGGFGGYGGYGQIDQGGTDIAKQMRDAGTALKAYYQQANAGTLDGSTVDMVAIQQNIGVLINGMDRLGRVVANNPIVGGRRCGNTKLRAGQFLKSMGDLVTSLAPYALLLAAGTATAGTGTVAAGAVTAATGGGALKYVLGAYSIGSIAKVYSDMIDADTIDMEKQDQREALLQNLCEYFRIEQRVNYLKQADMGQIRNINERMKKANDRLNQFKKKTSSALAQVFPPRVMQIADIEENISGQLNQAGKSVQNAKKEMAEVLKLTNGSDNQLLCSTGQLLADEAASAESFAGKVLKTYNSILSKQTRVTFAQKALVKSEEKIRGTLTNKKYMDQLQEGRQCAPGTTCTPDAQCAEIAKGYISTLSKIIYDADQKTRSLQNSLDVQLSSDPEYKEFKSTQFAVKREVAIRENTGKLVALLSNDNAAIVYGEINRQMDVLKRALMSSKWNRKAPVTKWLESSEDQFGKSLNTYKSEVSSLDQDALAIMRAYRGTIYVVDIDKKIKPMTPIYIEKIILQNREAVDKLGVVNLNMAPIGTEKHQSVCQKLQTLNLRWHTTIGHLKAEKFFCDNIKTMMDAIVDPAIGNFCYGKVNSIDGTIYRKSMIEKNLNDLARQYGNKARVIDGKYRELQCETKDATQVMQ
jgi:hypothetical protein